MFKDQRKGTVGYRQRWMDSGACKKAGRLSGNDEESAVSPREEDGTARSQKNEGKKPLRSAPAKFR